MSFIWSAYMLTMVHPGADDPGVTSIPLRKSQHQKISFLKSFDCFFFKFQNYLHVEETIKIPIKRLTFWKWRRFGNETDVVEMICMQDQIHCLPFPNFSLIVARHQIMLTWNYGPLLVRLLFYTPRFMERKNWQKTRWFLLRTNARFLCLPFPMNAGNWFISKLLFWMSKKQLDHRNHEGARK